MQEFVVTFQDRSGRNIVSYHKMSRAFDTACRAATLEYMFDPDLDPGEVFKIEVEIIE